MAVPIAPLQTHQLDQVDKWLRSILWDHKLPGADSQPEFEIHRCKGRFVFEDGSVKILQGVREVFELIDTPNSGEDGPVGGKIILIGRKVVDVDFTSSFQSTINEVM